MHLSRRRFLAGSFYLSTGAASVLLAGCGSGGSSSVGGTPALAPTATTRARVQSLHETVARQLSSSGAPESALAFTRNGYANGTAAQTTLTTVEASAAGSETAVPNLPTLAATQNLGGFLKNIASAPPQSRMARQHKTRDVVSASTASVPDINVPISSDNYVYRDEYLDLWARVKVTPSVVTYTLYTDSYRTTSGGGIIITQPADYTAYPQIYDSSYSFTAGYLAGSHGTSKNTTNADGSFTSDYANVYQDGTSDSGKSDGSANGDFSWQARTDGVDKSWTQGAGTFLSNGSGTTRFSTSNGYQSDYTYHADGSGQGNIAGGDPGLPATLTWDTSGNTTIRYANGSVETYAAYLYNSDNGVGGTNNGGSAPDNGGTVSPSAPYTSANGLDGLRGASPIGI